MAPTVSGTLIAINVTVGQHVNQVLAQVDPAKPEASAALVEIETVVRDQPPPPLLRTNSYPRVIAYSGVT